MKVFPENKKATFNHRGWENRGEYNINVTDFMKNERENIFNTLAEGKGKLEIRAGSVTLTFWNLSDKKKFLVEREARTICS